MRLARDLPHVARTPPRPQGPRPRAAHGMGGERRRRRRVHGRRPLDRARRAAAARRAAGVGPLRRRHRVPPRARLARRPASQARADLAFVQPASSAPCSRRACATRNAASRRCAPTSRAACCPRSRTTGGSSTPNCCCWPSATACGFTRCRSTGSTTPTAAYDVASTAFDDLEGTARMARAVRARWRRSISVPTPRAPLADDFGRRFVSFSLIGAASTAVSLVLVPRASAMRSGAVAANVSPSPRRSSRTRGRTRATRRAVGTALASCVRVLRWRRSR